MAEARGERITVDPRREFRARKAARVSLAEGRPISGSPADPPPSLLGDEVKPTRAPWDPNLTTTGPAGPEPFDAYKEALRIQIRPGQKPNRRSRVRIYHRPDNGGDLCWCFTITRGAWETLQTVGLLDSDGATWPDGRSIVLDGEDPIQTAPVRCGTCGTHSVECLQMEFFQD